MNSLVIVLFLSGMVAMIMLRTLHKDIARYNQMDSTVSETSELFLGLLCIVFIFFFGKFLNNIFSQNLLLKHFFSEVILNWHFWIRKWSLRVGFVGRDLVTAALRAELLTVSSAPVEAEEQCRCRSPALPFFHLRAVNSVSSRCSVWEAAKLSRVTPKQFLYVYIFDFFIINFNWIYIISTFWCIQSNLMSQLHFKLCNILHFILFHFPAMICNEYIKLRFSLFSLP